MKLNEKGFSLVELIIVIAIMAVLVGVVGTQVIPYMESSRKAKDIQILSSYATAGVMAYTLHAEDVPDDLDDNKLVITITSASGKDVFTASRTECQRIADELRNLVGRDAVTDHEDVFLSKEFEPTEKITVEYDFTDRTIKVLAIDGTGYVINANDNIYGIL